jgi:hypothetical protein
MTKILVVLAIVALMTAIWPAAAQAHRMTGRDIRATGMHHCAWSAATACKKKTLRRQVPCGNGRYCRW